MNWKILAIILLIIVLLENGLIVWGAISISQEEKEMNIYYYDVCEDYSNAYYENKICSCYENDLMGNEVLAKSKYMGKR